MWQYMLVCGVGAKPVAHLMKHHLLQWKVAKVKPLMNQKYPKVEQPKFE